MSDFNLRSVIRQEITKALEKRGAGPGFGGYEKGPTSHGPGGTKGFLGPGFKK